MTLREHLAALGVPFLEREPLKLHTTFRIGGPAPILILPASVRDLTAALAGCRLFGQEPFIMGHGSNLLVADRGVARPVILLGESFAAVRREGDRIIAQAGALLLQVCRFALSERLGGLEWAYGIPGSVGGAVCMNAGAYGGELKNHLVSVTFLDEKTSLRTLPAEALGLGYRRSVFEKRNLCVVEAEIRLVPAPPAAILGEMRKFMGLRREKQPLDIPSAGSVFKRPEGLAASALIDRCGLKGLAVGGAEVSRKHAGFIVNRGGATAGEVRELIRRIRRTVREQTGVELECEIRMIG